MAIPLGFPEFNSNPESSPLQPGWKLFPVSPVHLVSFLGDADPAPLEIEISIKDYAISHPQYENIYVAYRLEHPYINGKESPLFTLSGPIGTAPDGYYNITTNSLDVTMQVNYALSNIIEGYFVAKIIFGVLGQTTDFRMEFLGQQEFEIHLFKLNTSALFILSQGGVEMSYLLGGVLPTPVQKRVYAKGAFTIESPEHIAITGVNITLLSIVDGIRTYQGSGTQDIAFVLENSINDDGDMSSVYQKDVVFRNGTDIYAVNVKVWLHSASQLLISPSKMEFSAVVGFFEATPQLLYLRGVGDFVITLPYWLELIGNPTGSAISYRTVRPLLSDNLSNGTYTGQIKILSGTTEYFIDVIHNVYSRVQPGYSLSNPNFTKDMEGISTYYEHDSRRVDIQLSVTAFGFANIETILREAAFSKSLYKNKASFWLGDIVDKVLATPTQLTDFAIDNLTNPSQNFSQSQISGYKVIPYYNPAEVRMFINFIIRETNAQDGETTYHAPRFLKGRKPKRFLQNAGILDYLTSPIRVTKNSFTILPIYRNESNSKISVFQNGNLIGYIFPDRGFHTVFGLQLSFGNFSPGDIIDVQIESLSLAQLQNPIALSQRYIMFPEGQKSYHIAWVTEHNVLQLYEFTGEYEFKTEHKAIINPNFKNFRSILQKLGSNKTVKFKANTGWILKSNQERVDSLTDANIAWIIFTDDTPPIELIPTDAKITNIDSTAETYQYDVEFNINPQHELENPAQEL